MRKNALDAPQGGSPADRTTAPEARAHSDVRRLEERVLELERALAASEARFDSVFYSDAVPMSFWTPEGRITEANDAYLRLVRATREDLEAGRVRWGSYTLPDQLDRDARALEELKAGKRSSTPYEKDYVLPDGTRVPVLISGSLLPGGSIDDGGFAFALDMTELRRKEHALRESEARLSVALEAARTEIAERKRLEEARRLLLESERAARDEAERVSRVKDDFVATLSHELRTPINAVLGWARLLRAKSADPKTLQRGLEVIERNSLLQAEMVSNLLDVSRIVSGKMRLDVQPVALAEIVESAVESVRLAADAKGIALTASLDPDVPRLRGDPARIQQIVWNLLSNAAKFTPAGGRIEVALRRSPAHVEVSVADSGAGIAPSFLQHIFERFQQADASSTRKFGGLGIGLSIVKHLVELHGGSVEAASPGEGKGATFTVRLPIGGAAPPRDGTAPVAGRAARAEALVECPDAMLDGVKVLVVDDQPDAREIAQRVLEERKAEVATAASAAEALDLLATERPDVLVSDLGMPDEDGYEFIRRVRARAAREGAGIPAVALSALARPDDRARALRAGYQAHIAKPLDPVELVLVVARLSGRLRDG